jgi:crotonobetainyl-CoA:carnitine CoA-transferase CaiB-like acyl-CoA transferase
MNPTASDGALNGVRVLDLTQALAGPFCTMLLGHLGADVVKVEPPTGDNFRKLWLPPEVAARRDAYEFQWVGTGKRSIVLNLRTEEGKGLFKRLAQWADILVENFSLGTMERLGVGYEVLRETNPRLIYATIKGFGLDGPYADRHSAAPVAAAMAGWTAGNWEHEDKWWRKHDRGPTGTKVNAPSDEVSGASALVGILAALYSRERTGRGQRIEVSMQEAVAGWMISWYHEHFEQYPVGNAPMQCKDGWYNFTGALVREEQWQALCRIMEREDLLLDERFATIEGRRHFASELDENVQAWMLTKTRHELWEMFEPLHGVNSPVLEVEEVFEDAHLKARDFWVEAPNQEEGTWPMAGPWIRMSETPARVQRWAPRLGEHTDDVCNAVLNLSQDEIKGLRERGVIS